MSDQSDTLSPHRPSETTQSAPNQSPRTPVRIVTDALDEIIAQVNRALGLQESNDSGATSPVNVVKEREFVFDDLDPSLLETEPTLNRRTDELSRTSVDRPAA